MSFESVQLPLPQMPIRVVMAMTITPGARTSVVVTCDPPSEDFSTVWYQDTITDVLTPEEAFQAAESMLWTCHRDAGVFDPSQEL